MDLGAYVDLYCERVAPGLLNEPFNAVTNLAFLAAAALLWMRAANSDARDPAIGALIALVAVIGLGSLSFHTFANGWSLLADVIPIALFIYAYFLFAMRRYFALGWLAAIAATLGYLVAANLFGLVFPRALLNGSGSYFPALLATLAIALLLMRRRHPAARTLLMAGAVFAVSIGFRSIDIAVCPDITTGTHFVWHLLNAGVLTLLMLAAIDHGRPAAPRH